MWDVLFLNLYVSQKSYHIHPHIRYLLCEELNDFRGNLWICFSYTFMYSAEIKWENAWRHIIMGEKSTIGPPITIQSVSIQFIWTVIGALSVDFSTINNFILHLVTFNIKTFIMLVWGVCMWLFGFVILFVAYWLHNSCNRLVLHCKELFC